MRWIIAILVGLVIAAAAGTGGYFLARHQASASTQPSTQPSSDEGSGEKAPTASVRVTPIVRGRIAQYITAYGSVIAPASEVRVLSVPFESRVSRILVTPGQVVEAKQPLIELQASAATALMLQDARNAADAAQRDLDLVNQRYEQRLATNTELYAAQNALRTAQAHLHSLQQAGAGGPTTQSTEIGGIVSKIDVQTGQVVPIGGPLVEIAGEKQVEVSLNVDPRDISALKVGQEVTLALSDGSHSKPVVGHIRLLGQRLDSATRLIPIMVSIPPDSNLVLDSFVSGKITRSMSEPGLIVPREAVLPNAEGGNSVFTVKDNHAVEHSVNIVEENDQQALVTGEDLSEGDQVVIAGNYELEDKMAVQVQSGGGESSTTEPSTSEAASTEPSASEPATTEPATQSAVPEESSKQEAGQ